MSLLSVISFIMLLFCFDNGKSYCKNIILSFIENKSILQEHTECYIINIYNMNVCINWSKLLKNYKDLIKEIS